MTLDEVITRLDAIATERYPMITDLDVEALRMAIKKLKKEPTTKNDLGVDCISRDVVKNYIQAHIHEIITESGEDKNKNTNRVLRSMIHGVNCMPSVTPQEPKTGHWKPYLKEGLRYQCSACDSRFDTPWEYCPHCGAKMAETEADNGNDD